MRTIFKTLIISFICIVLTNCTDEDFNSKYNDPSKVNDVTVGNLMTGVFQKAKDYSCYDYGRFFCLDPTFLGKCAQTYGFVYSTDMYSPAYEPGIDNQWSNVYSCMMQYKKLEQLYLEETPEEQAQDEAFYLAAKVHFYDYFTATTNIFGDMPFSKACTLPFNNDVEAAHAPFDKAEDIYKTIIEDLKAIGPRFREVKTPRNFNTQDFINNGDLDKWERYANSLRLRLALRVATQGPLVEVGRNAIKEILENPETYPLVEEQSNNIYIVNQKSGQLNFTAGSGLGDVGWESNRWASGAIIDRMLSHGAYDMNSNDTLSGKYVKGTDDPRILLYYNATKIVNRNTGELDSAIYLGTNLTISDDVTEYYRTQAMDEYGNAGFSQITQYGFFWNNDKFDMLIIASPEVHFNIAEAYLMGYGVGKDENKAREALEKAIAQSIELYYYYDNISTGQNARRFTAPTQEEIVAFAASKWDSDEYVDHLDAIITQKWLHYGILLSREAWNEIRRTGYPSGLVYPEVSGIVPNVPDRWRYPQSEVNYNPYYKDVQSEDTYYTKMFWAKQD